MPVGMKLLSVATLFSPFSSRSAGFSSSCMLDSSLKTIVDYHISQRFRFRVPRSRSSNQLPNVELWATAAAKESKKREACLGYKDTLETAAGEGELMA